MAVKKSTKSKIVTRPPVVCILGHVDHGKTTLLDYIRKTTVASKESGGITQHIGAYQIKLKAQSSKRKAKEKKEELITFIDTPGHAAFVKLRSRGAKVTDLAVLVIDALDGVKPQTLECLQHIKREKIPFLVAINKMDLAGASEEKVKSQLAEKGVLVEKYGGDIVCVPISAKTGEGVDELLEMVILVAQMQDLKADLKVAPQAVIIDSYLDSRRGPTATLLVKNGVFKIGDLIITKKSKGRIKAMFDENGKRIEKALPSKPFLILGFKKVPKVGDKVKVIKEKINNKISRRKTSVPLTQEIGKSADFSGNFKKPEQEKLKIILKADTLGSLEAIKDSLSEKIDLIFQGVGKVNESDILLAGSTSAMIFSFRVNVSKQVKKLAEFEGIKIKSYEIIYHLLEDMEKKALKLLKPETEERILGRAEIIAEFKMKGSHIAGCKVKKGTIEKKNLIHIERDGKLISDTRIKSLQKQRRDTSKGELGEEIGLVFSPDVDFSIGDDIISYNKK